jgi:copper resistance protein B
MCAETTASENLHHHHGAHDHPINKNKNHPHGADKKHEMSNHGMEDDPLISYFNIDELEWRNNHSENTLAWDIEAWTGYDTNKLWLKAEGEKTSCKTEHSEVQLLQSHAISSFWDLQTGIRIDTKPGSRKHWFAIGFYGVAPYFTETDTALFIGEGGDIAWRLKMEQEWMLTQRIALVPVIEFNFHSKNDSEHHTGSGLSSSEFGLRLHYNIRRNVSPYIGLHAYKTYGKTSHYLRSGNENTRDAQLVIGLHTWY